MGEKDEKRQDEDTEGQGRKISPGGTEEDDTQGQRRSLAPEGTEDDTEGHRRR
jgi:hypothetical protein